MQPLTTYAKPLEFSRHALERGLQVGLSEDDLLLLISHAKRMKADEISKRRLRPAPSTRFYRNCSTVFIVNVKKNVRVVLTVLDDIVVRNEGYRL